MKVGSDVSDALFHIEAVRVIAPTAMETLHSGSPYTIRWTTSEATALLVSRVALFYTLNGGATWQPISLVDSGGNPIAGNPGSFDWTPVVSKKRTVCRVKVVLKDAEGNSLGKDISAGIFTIDP
jgi:hypothetical protein